MLMFCLTRDKCSPMWDYTTLTHGTHEFLKAPLNPPDHVTPLSLTPIGLTVLVRASEKNSTVCQNDCLLLFFSLLFLMFLLLFLS